MDSLFKQKLLGLLNPTVPRTFREALFEGCSWVKVKEVSEKKPDIEIFTDQKNKEEKTDHEWSDVKRHTSFESLKNQLKIDPRFLPLIFSGKEEGKVKALFVTEKFRSWEDVSMELRTGLINELLMGFPLKTAELFERMIKAMKLEASEVMIYPVEGSDEADFSADVMAIAAFYGSDVIIPLGAKATNHILKSNDRLSVIHGQFFGRNIFDKTLQVVPLFHPSIIETNQNMKKTAWADMQKIMQHLKKIP
jgi:hypothetical protein